jgi:hypothetical protein
VFKLSNELCKLKKSYTENYPYDRKKKENVYLYYLFSVHKYLKLTHSIYEHGRIKLSTEEFSKKLKNSYFAKVTSQERELVQETLIRIAYHYYYDKISEKLKTRISDYTLKLKFIVKCISDGKNLEELSINPKEYWVLNELYKQKQMVSNIIINFFMEKLPAME